VSTNQSSKACTSRHQYSVGTNQPNTLHSPSSPCWAPLHHLGRRNKTQRQWWGCRYLLGRVDRIVRSVTIGNYPPGRGYRQRNQSNSRTNQPHKPSIVWNLVMRRIDPLDNQYNCLALSTADNAQPGSSGMLPNHNRTHWFLPNTLSKTPRCRMARNNPVRIACIQKCLDTGHMNQ